ncbi:24785_t:CDS:1, partial [Racocetra persica]
FIINRSELVKRLKTETHITDQKGQSLTGLLMTYLTPLKGNAGFMHMFLVVFRLF